MNTMLIVGLLFSITSNNISTTFNNRFINSSNFKSVYSYYFENNTFYNVDTFSSLKIGVFNENNNDRYYESIITCSFPFVDQNIVNTASLTLTKYSGYAQSISVDYCFNYVRDTDPSNYTWTYYGTLSLQGNSYYMSVKNAMLAALNNNENFVYFRLYFSGSVNLGAESIYVSNDPKFTYKLDLLPNDTGYGAATTYVMIPWVSYSTSMDHLLANCYGYAIDGHGVTNCAELFNGHFVDVTDIPGAIDNIINTSKNVFNVNVRQIESYTSPIFPFERRIAFQYNETNTQYPIGTYHFIRQTDNGYWASTCGYHDANSKLHQYTDPESFDWGSEWNKNNMYNSDIYYFAVTTLGGWNTYVNY